MANSVNALGHAMTSHTGFYYCYKTLIVLTLAAHDTITTSGYRSQDIAGLQ
jgi:hypothetical protein